MGTTSSSLISAQDFTPEKKAVVRAPRRGPLPGRKKKVRVFYFVPTHWPVEAPQASPTVTSHGLRSGSVRFGGGEAVGPRETPGPADIRFHLHSWLWPMVSECCVRGAPPRSRRPPSRCCPREGLRGQFGKRDAGMLASEGGKALLGAP